MIHVTTPAKMERKIFLSKIDFFHRSGPVAFFGFGVKQLLSRIGSCDASFFFVLMSRLRKCIILVVYLYI